LGTGSGLAELTLRIRNPQEARTQFARAVELGSTDSRVYFDYAMVLREVKEKNGPPLFRWRAAELDGGYQEAHAIWPSPCWRTRAGFSSDHGLACSYRQLQKLDEAHKAGEARASMQEVSSRQLPPKTCAGCAERLAGLRQHIAAQPAREQAAVRPWTRPVLEMRGPQFIGPSS
jgi:hypothetical protein